MNCSIRSASTADAAIVYAFICALSEKQFDAPTFEKIYLHNLQSEHNIYLVAEIDGKVAGFLGCQGQLLLHHAAWVYEIQEMYTEEAYRSKGIGKQLLDELLQKLSNRQYDVLEVSSGNRRKEAHAFYLRNGFTQTHQKFTLKGNL